MKHLILFLLIALISAVLLTASECDAGIEKDPEEMKIEFILSLTKADVSKAKKQVETYSYLVEKFNIDIYIGFLNCFKYHGDREDCLELLQVLRPSFNDVSESSSTPIIHALIFKNMVVLNELLKMPECIKLVDKSDIYGSTALMYAAKSGSMYAVRRILDKSLASINFKNSYGKTALHYACQINDIPPNQSTQTLQFPAWLSGDLDYDTDNKKEIFELLLNNGAIIFTDGPEYQLTAKDSIIASEIRNHHGKVKVEQAPGRFISKALLQITVSQFFKIVGLSGVSAFLQSKLIGLILANPIMMVINELCYYVQQLMLPGIDMNFVISLDLGDKFQDFSFNILFVLIIGMFVKQILKEIY